MFYERHAAVKGFIGGRTAGVQCAFAFISSCENTHVYTRQPLHVIPPCVNVCIKVSAAMCSVSVIQWSHRGAVFMSVLL